ERWKNGRTLVRQRPSRHFAANFEPNQKKENRQQSFRKPLSDSQCQYAVRRTDAKGRVDEDPVIGCQWRVRRDKSKNGSQQQNKAARGRKAREHSGGTVNLLRDRLLQRFEQGVEIPGAVVADTIDEHGGRTRDAIAPALAEVLIDAFFGFLGIEIAAKPLHVEPEFFRKFERVLFLERKLMFIEKVVHVPEAPLR